MVRYSIAILCALMLLAAGCKKTTPTVCHCTYTPNPTNQFWYIATGTDTTASSLPDFYANYFLYRFDRTNLRNVGLKIKGAYAQARYMSYNVYNLSSATTLGSLLDVNITPCCANHNPYTGNTPFGNNDIYTIQVLPSTANTTGMQNVLTYDNSIDTLVVMLRYYVPVGGVTGGTDLPVITAYDITTGDSLPTPPLCNGGNGSQQGLHTYISQFYATDTDSTLYSYHLTLAGLYNNYDNQYLCMPITPDTGAVYVLRFKAPNYASAVSQNGTADVRYWSINQGDDYTFTHAAIKDADMHVAADGYVNLVIANFDSAISAKAAGLNKMPVALPTGTRMFLVYRNLVTHTGFTGNMSQVPILNTTDLANYTGYRADAFIGNYAPKGRRMTRQQFLNNFGGVPVSY